MPQNIDDLLKQADQLEQQQDYKKLAEVYQKIATHYHKQKDKQKNEEYLIKSKKNELQAIANLPNSINKAEQLEKFVAINKNHPRVYFELARTYQNLNYFDKARENYEKSINILGKKDTKNSVITCNNLANLLTNYYFKEYELAKKYYENAIELNPNYSFTYSNLAILLANDYFKNYDLAKKYFEKAIELNPNQYGAYHNLAKLYFENFNDKESANHYFTKAIHVNKESILTRKELAKTIEKTPFLTKIEIKKLRHLENLIIDIDDNELKHILLTGANGSGKTTVLNECKNFFQSLLEIPLDQLFSVKSREEIFEPKTYNFRLFFSTKQLTDLRLAYESGVFVVKYLGANTGKDGNRSLNPNGVKTIDKVELPFVNKIEENLADKIVAYLVDLDYTKLRALGENNQTKFKEIENWFTNFVKILKSFDENIVNIKYSDNQNNHNFILQVRMSDNKIVDVNFNELPDGFKAIFKIVFEIILQMQSKVDTTYNIPGIVMIDKPELFLHINLQKKVMPTLTKLFPNIQFIVATHSAYVLNSISNAVIFDMETRQRLVDVSEIPENKLYEYYFKMTPEKVKQIIEKINNFENLINLYKEKKLTEEQNDLLVELESELNKITPYISDEYFEKFKENQKYLYE